MMKNYEKTSVYGMDRPVIFDPNKVRPIIVDGIDAYEKAVITEASGQLLIGWDDGIDRWVCLGTPDQPGWEWMEPDPDDAESIAQAIRASDAWQLDLDDKSPERMLCKLAGLEDKLNAVLDSEDDDFEPVVYKAAEILGVEI